MLKERRSDNMNTYIYEAKTFEEAKNKALNILSKADQSEKKIKEKLHTDFEEETINKVIDFLKRNKFIDDNLLAHKIVNTNLNLNKCGKNRIKQNLYNKGLDTSSIIEAMSEIDSDTEFENAMHLAKKRYERIKSTLKNVLIFRL